MAFKKTLAKRLLNITKISNYRISSSVRSPNPSKPGIAPDPGDNGIFRRFLHKRPVFLSELRQPSANTILPRLREMDIARSRIRLDGLTPPEKLKLAPNDMRKLLRHVRLEAVKSKLRDIPQSCITYSEFFRICDEICSDPEEARSIAQMLEDSSSVMIFGDVVHLRPEKVNFFSVFLF